jgi:hypothetical protein
MWETILNVGMVVIGLALLMLVSWAVDKDKKDKSEDWLKLDDDDF